MMEGFAVVLGVRKLEDESRNEEPRYVTRNPLRPVMNRMIICLRCSVRGAERAFQNFEQ
jgi:hypothetical protein